MAFPTAVNGGASDSVSQVSVDVLGAVPAVATANLMTATSDALALAAHNATYAQQQTNDLARTVTTVGTKIINSFAPKG